MMDETGYGKTSLIRGNKMVTMNIHAGISNKDIIIFINENNLIENDDNDNKDKIWVVLDERNTCNAMGLISERMWKGAM